MQKVTQAQIEKILKDAINIPGIAKVLKAKGFGQQVKVVLQKTGERFIDNGDGTITDTHLGVQWVKNPHTDLPDVMRGQLTFANASARVEQLDFAGYQDWRVPTVEELRAIVDYTRGVGSDPAIDTGIFPDTKTSWYWTVTPCVWNKDYVWVVSFGYGSVSTDGRVGADYVRPVRSSQ